jgi:hypothetical protein
MCVVIEVTKVEQVANHSLCVAEELKTGQIYRFWVDGKPELVGRFFTLTDMRLRPLYDDSWTVWGVRKEGGQTYNGGHAE